MPRMKGDKKKKPIKKEMEYPDAPSGFVTLYNYKEPFMPYVGGYGYQGVLLFDGTTDKVQCHFCGSWEQNLPSHLWYKHQTRANDYKITVGLGHNTALISEKIRAKMIECGQERFKNLVPFQKKMSDEMKEKIREGLRKYRESMEMKNQNGTCPLQLITRLRALADKLGRVPVTDEVTFYNTLCKVYGSYENACRKAGLTALKPGQNLNRRTQMRYDKETLIKLVREFIKENGRDPSASDTRRQLLPSMQTFLRKCGGLKRAIKLAKA